VALAAKVSAEVNGSGPENPGRWVYHNNQRTNSSVPLLRQTRICGHGGKPRMC